MTTLTYYHGEMTIREWIEQHPNVNIEDTVSEGYGDGWFYLEDVLDENDFNVYYDEERNYAAFGI